MFVSQIDPVRRTYSARSLSGLALALVFQGAAFSQNASVAGERPVGSPVPQAFGAPADEELRPHSGRPNPNESHRDWRRNLRSQAGIVRATKPSMGGEVAPAPYIPPYPASQVRFGHRPNEMGAEERAKMREQIMDARRKMAQQRDAVESPATER